MKEVSVASGNHLVYKSSGIPGEQGTAGVLLGLLLLDRLGCVVFPFLSVDQRVLSRSRIWRADASRSPGCLSWPLFYKEETCSPERGHAWC